MFENFIKNILIVLTMFTLFVALYMVLCRDARHFRGIDRELDQDWVYAFVSRLFFVVTTITTIGYGDITPLTIRCRLLTIGIILCMFVLVLKFFDSAIETYNRQFHEYVDPLFAMVKPPSPSNPPNPPSWVGRVGRVEK
jgi:hypothetical protein